MPSPKNYTMTVEEIAARLAELPALEEEYERAKHACVGGSYPVSEEIFHDWLKGQSAQQIEDSPVLGRYNDALAALAGAQKGLSVPSSIRQQAAMTQLIEMFPSLRGAPGSNPFNEFRFTDWIENQASPQTVHAGRFVISIWHREPGTFNLSDAFVAWDETHRQAYVDWLDHPLMPHCDLWGEC